MSEKQMPKTISQALVAAQRAYGPALKNAFNPDLKNKYADLGSCIDAVLPGLNANGLALVQKTHPAEAGVAVETIFVHESGEQYSCGVLNLPAQKNDPQGYGSALTYARRYSLCAACGIAPEDDDGNAARGGARRERTEHPLSNIPARQPQVEPKRSQVPGETPKQAATRLLIQAGQTWQYGPGLIEAEGAERKKLWVSMVRDHGAITDDQGIIHTSTFVEGLAYALIGEPALNNAKTNGGGNENAVRAE